MTSQAMLHAWTVTGGVVLALLLVGVPLLYAGLEPPRHVYAGKRRAGEDGRPLSGARHRIGWPARDVRLLSEHTGEWSIEDVAEALYVVEVEMREVRDLVGVR